MSKLFSLQEITNRLIKQGSFDLSSDTEYNKLDATDQRVVRQRVRFYLLQES